LFRVGRYVADQGGNRVVRVELAANGTLTNVSAVASLRRPWDVTIASAHGGHRVLVASEETRVVKLGLDGSDVSSLLTAPGIRALVACPELDLLFWASASAVMASPLDGDDACDGGPSTGDDDSDDDDGDGEEDDGDDATVCAKVLASGFLDLTSLDLAASDSGG